MIADLPVTDVDKNVLDVMESFTLAKVAAAASQADRDKQLQPGLLAELDKLGVFGPSDEAPSPSTQLLLLETLAGGDAGLAYQLAGEVAARRLVEAVGRDAPAGTRYAFAYYEGYGRSPLELQASASPSADGGWTLSGTKRAVILPAGTAGVVLIATVDGQLAAFLVESSGLAQIAVERDDHIVGRLGIRSAQTGDLSFDRVIVPAAGLVGSAGSAAVLREVEWFRLAVAEIALGVARASTRYAVAYAQVRESFGQPIISYQGVEFPLVESDMAQDAARLEILATWSQVEAGGDAARLAQRVSNAYGVAVAAGVNSTLVGVNSLGGHGYLTDHPVERWYRDATTLAAFDFDPLAHSGSIV